MIFLNVRTRFCCHIDLLTHREAVTGYPAGHRLASFCARTRCHENLYLCIDTLRAKEYHHNLILIHMSQDNHPHDTAPTPNPNSVGREKGGNNEVHSVSDFIEKITPILEECNGSEIFYRGHADISWKLQPSIFRKSNKEEKEDQSNGIRKEHLLFRDMVAHTPQSFSICKSALDYLVQMQHYELPTRLLDVSTNPLVALYFACQPTKDDALAGALHGATVGEKLFKEAQKVACTILSVLQGEVPTDTIVAEVAQTIIEAIPSVDVEPVKGAIMKTILPDAISCSTDISADQKILEVVVGSLAEAATAATTVYSRSLIPLVSALIVVLSAPGPTSEYSDVFSRIAAVTGALAGAGVGAGGGRNATSVTFAAEGIDALFANKQLNDQVKFAILRTALSGEGIGAEEGVKARARDGAVYLFSIPEDRTKHYDSDTVSVLANLAKCSDREIDIYTEQTKGVVKAKVLEQFNKRAGIQILLRQIKEEKPYFDPLIRPNDLSSIFLVKAKYGNPRIINQAGAFFIFGLGLIPSAEGRGGRLTKRVDHEIPSDWIRYKFIIPKEKKPDILDELARMGITESYLFPEMDKYAKELKKKYEL